MPVILCTNQILLKNIKSSQLLILMMVVVHALAAFSVLHISFAVSTEIFIKAFIFVMIMFSYFYYRTKILHITSVLIKSDGKWDLFSSNKVIYTDKVLEYSYVSDWIIILIFPGRGMHRKIYTYLLRDSIDVKFLSELRCMLKIGCKYSANK